MSYAILLPNSATYTIRRVRKSFVEDTSAKIVANGYRYIAKNSSSHLLFFLILSLSCLLYIQRKEKNEIGRENQRTKFIVCNL
jgi:hypothetical protein